MKTRIQSFLASTTIALFFLASAAVAQDCASQGGVIVHPGQGVEFSQVSYSFDEVLANVGLQPSSTGEVDVDTSQLQTIMSSGFVNVVTDAGWVTQNLPILATDNDAYDISTTLNLNIAAGSPLSSLNATVCYSSQSLTQISSAAFDTFTVGSTEYSAEGIGDQGMDFIPPPPPIGGLTFDSHAPDKSYMQPLHSADATDVQTADNQCAPASVANSFAWLNLRWNVPIPDANILGLRDTVAGSLVGELDMDMQSPDPKRYPKSCANDQPGRWAFDRAKGFGTPALSQLRGSLWYLSDNNILNLTLKHQGLSPFSCDGFNGAANVNFKGLVSTGQGTKVDPTFIYNEVRNDSAVEYDGVWYNRFAQPAGGHAMDIVGAGTTKNRAWIYYVSDHLQTKCGAQRNKDGSCPFFINDDKGTTYTGKDGKQHMIVDFSYLIPSNLTPNQQPLIYGGQMNGAYAVSVMTQHP